jgi:hypothetical protein
MYIRSHPTPPPPTSSIRASSQLTISDPSQVEASGVTQTQPLMKSENQKIWPRKLTSLFDISPDLRSAGVEGVISPMQPWIYIAVSYPYLFANKRLATRREQSCSLVMLNMAVRGLHSNHQPTESGSSGRSTR